MSKNRILILGSIILFLILNGAFVIWSTTPEEGKIPNQNDQRYWTQILSSMSVSSEKKTPFPYDQIKIHFIEKKTSHIFNFFAGHNLYDKFNNVIWINSDRNVSEPIVPQRIRWTSPLGEQWSITDWNPICRVNINVKNASFLTDEWGVKALVTKIFFPNSRFIPFILPPNFPIEKLAIGNHGTTLTVESIENPAPWPKGFEAFREAYLKNSLEPEWEFKVFKGLELILHKSSGSVKKNNYRYFVISPIPSDHQFWNDHKLIGWNKKPLKIYSPSAHEAILSDIPEIGNRIEFNDKKTIQPDWEVIKNHLKINSLGKVNSANTRLISLGIEDMGSEIKVYPIPLNRVKDNWIIGQF